MNNNKSNITIADEFVLKIARQSKRDRIINWIPFFVLVVMCIILSIASPGSFATWDNVQSILNQMAIPLLIALGLTFVIIIGSIDLSIDGVVGMSGSIVSVLVFNSVNGNNMLLGGILISVASCVLSGALVGIIHVKGRIPSFMVSFGMAYIAMGIGIMAYGGFPATILDPILVSIPNAKFLHVPMITWVALAMLAFCYFLQEYTAFGRHIYAVGSDESIPRAAGINVDLVKIKVFTFAGLCFGIAGVLGAIRLGQGQIGIGKGTMFPAQAAVVVGGTSLSGGKGGVINTLIGTMIMTVLENGLILLGVNSYIKTGVQGLIILIAVAITINRSKQNICK